jgi:hypothetical protein
MPTCSIAVLTLLIICGCLDSFCGLSSHLQSSPPSTLDYSQKAEKPLVLKGDACITFSRMALLVPAPLVQLLQLCYVSAC